MIKQVYKPSRFRSGKRIVGRMYRGRYRLDPREKIKDVALHTDEKQVAEQRLARIVRDEQHEREGLIPPKQQRDAAQLPLITHVQAFVADRRAIKCDDKYVLGLERKLLRLINECSWRFVRDVTPESFCVWREKQTHSAKTLNDYLNAVGGLMNWLESRIGANPLRFVQKVQTACEPKRTRRAFSVAELRRLIAAGGDRGIIYLVAASTGIRRGELRSLEWRDVVLDMPQPFIFVRRSIAKNHKDAKQPLPDYVAREWEKLRPTDFGPNERVFQRGMPDMDTFRKDLVAAGIDYIDNQGRFADFHALRTTFSTLLAVLGVAERIRMELNRHSDPKLTAKTYTDAKMLPVCEAVAMLPVMIGGVTDSHIDSHKLVGESPNVSAAVPIEPGKPILLTAGNEVLSPSQTPSVPQSPETGESAPCRNRTCNPLIKSQLLCQLS